MKCRLLPALALWCLGCMTAAQAAAPAPAAEISSPGGGQAIRFEAI